LNFCKCNNFHANKLTFSLELGRFTDVTRGGPVCSDRPRTSVHGRLYNIYYTDVHATGPGHPLCRRLATVQPSRATGDGWGIQLTWSCRRQCVTITDVRSADCRRVCLRMRIRNNSRDPRTNPHRLFTKIRGRGWACILQKSVILDRF